MPTSDYTIPLQNRKKKKKKKAITEASQTLALVGGKTNRGVRTDLNKRAKDNKKENSDFTRASLCEGEKFLLV